jgi:hypothetical protein
LTHKKSSFFVRTSTAPHGLPEKLARAHREQIRLTSLGLFKAAHVVIVITAAAALVGVDKGEGGLGHVKRRAVTLIWPLAG